MPGGRLRRTNCEALLTWAVMVSRLKCPAEVDLYDHLSGMLACGEIWLARMLP